VRTVPIRQRNDIKQYDDLVDAWWRPEAGFAALHWLAAARSGLVPRPLVDGEVLLDLGCGGGLMAPHASSYRHVGVDLSASALTVAAGHRVLAVRGDVTRLPVADGAAAVVVAGELLEHVLDLEAVVAEMSRVLRPGGTVVIDTINATRAARLALVGIAERLPGGPPPRIHDPELFVCPDRLGKLFAEHGVDLRVWGIRPSARDYARFLADRRQPVRMVPTRSLALVYQGIARKEDR
jgi:2-polyprenyl-6-hydroxyphenyl methylase/3-demethylubiquinone-9 3-methyltransferase